jgi:hypothetical protein
MTNGEIDALLDAIDAYPKEHDLTEWEASFVAGIRADRLAANPLGTSGAGMGFYRGVIENLLTNIAGARADIAADRIGRGVTVRGVTWP